jgi:hypothetical protein
MPLRPTLNYNFQFPTTSNTNMSDEEMCEVVSTIVTLKTEPYNDIWPQSYRKYKTLEGNILCNLT